jgi:mannose-6-phosphate isomerase-like protein (cupin superfamily)
MAAGDIVCGSGTTTGWCRQQQTSDLILAHNPDAILALGDVQYECAQMFDFTTYFDPTWGRFKSKIYPTTGNHEYKTSTNPSDVCYGAPPNAQDYFAYFGPVAGDPAKGYYSFNLGAWHLVALNSNCSQVGGCAAGSAQERWLRADLQANASQCTLAFMHYPRFSTVAPYTSMQALWQALYDYGAEIVLAAHDHHYERYDPCNPAGGADPTWGIREFIVGTGGKQPNQSFGTMDQPVAKGTVPGVLKLTLRATGYDWQFVPISGYTYNDSGSGTCHGAPSGASITSAFLGVTAAGAPSAPTGDSATMTNQSPSGSSPAIPDAHGGDQSQVSLPGGAQRFGLLAFLAACLLLAVRYGKEIAGARRRRWRDVSGHAYPWLTLVRIMRAGRKRFPAISRRVGVVAPRAGLIVVVAASFATAHHVPAASQGRLLAVPGLSGQPLARVDLASLPPAPAILAFARFTYQPGAAFPHLEVPGPEVIVAEQGVLTVDVRGETDDASEVREMADLFVPAEAGRQSVQIAAPGQIRFTLLPGDRLLVPEDTPHSIANPGSVPAVYLAAAITPQPPSTSGPIWPPAGVGPPSPPAGIAIEPLGAGYGVAARLPEGAVQLRLDRVMLNAGSSVQNVPCAGTESWYVEAGKARITIRQGQAIISQPSGALAGAAKPAGPGTDVAVARRDAVLLQDGCTVSVRAVGSERLVLLTLSVVAQTS